MLRKVCVFLHRSAAAGDIALHSAHTETRLETSCASWYLGQQSGAICAAARVVIASMAAAIMKPLAVVRHDTRESLRHGGS